MLFAYCCYDLGMANAICLAHANLPLYLPNSRFNVLLVAQETSLSDSKSAPQVASTSAVRPSLLAAGRRSAQP